MKTFNELEFEIEFESEFDSNWNDFDNQPLNLCLKTLDPIYLLESIYD